MPWDYSDKVLKLFMAAVKGEAGTHMGDLENPDGFGEHGSIVCGDTLQTKDLGYCLIMLFLRKSASN